MMETALEEIKRAEKEADRLIEQARQQSQAIISEARSKAARFLNEKEEELAGQKANSLERQREKILAARQKLLAEGSERITSLRKGGEKRKEEAAALVAEAFEREIGVYAA